MADVRVSVDAGRLYVQAGPRWETAYKQLLAAAWDDQAQAIVLPATAGAMEDVSDLVAVQAAQGAQVTRSAATQPLLDAVRQARQARALRTAEDLPDFPGKMPAWIHQRQAFWFAESQFGVMLAMDMGTGKSKVTVGLLDHWGADLVVILCPKSVVGVWPREFAKHSTRPWSVWAGGARGARGPLKNPSVSKRAAAADLHAERHRIAGTPAAIVCNYDSCWQPAMEKVLLTLCRSGRVLALVLDESHRVKAPAGKASRFCYRLSRAVEVNGGRALTSTTLREQADAARRAGGRVLELTGTPMAHSPLDVFGQYRCIDPSVFGTNHGRFKRRYAITAPIPDGKGAEMIVGLVPEHEPELTERFHRYAYVCSKRDLVARGVLSIPPSTEDFRECTLGEKATKLYLSLEEDFVARLDEGTVTVANAMVKLLRLQQITGGHVPLDLDSDPPPAKVVDEHGNDITAEVRAEHAADHQRLQEVLDQMGLLEAAARTERPPQPGRKGGRILEIDTAKLDLLVEVLGDYPADYPVVCFARFRHDLDMIERAATKLRRPFAELSGRRRDALTHDSLLADGVGLAGVQIQSGGVGIDFTLSSLAAYWSIGHSLGDYEQSMARLDRPGQKLPVQFLHFVARLATGAWSADRRVYQALRRRQNVVQAVMRAKGRWDMED